MKKNLKKNQNRLLIIMKKNHEFYLLNSANAKK